MSPVAACALAYYLSPTNGTYALDFTGRTVNGKPVLRWRRTLAWRTKATLKQKQNIHRGDQ